MKNADQHCCCCAIYCCCCCTNKHSRSRTDITMDCCVVLLLLHCAGVTRKSQYQVCIYYAWSCMYDVLAVSMMYDRYLLHQHHNNNVQQGEEPRQKIIWFQIQSVLVYIIIRKKSGLRKWPKLQA